MIALPSREALAGFKVISFDIFDTLVLRPFSKPVDLFALIPVRAERDGSPVADTQEFAVKRIEAEQAARTKAWHAYQGVEVSLTEIYAELPYSVDVSNRLMAAEIELECDCVRPDRRMVDLLLDLYHSGQKIVLISDFYLSLETVKRIVAACDLPNDIEVFVSCELGKTKAQGDLFRHVAGHLEVAAQDIFHIGDNYQSDVTKGKEVGLTTFYYPKLDRLHGHFSRFTYAQPGEAPGVAVWRSFVDALLKEKTKRSESNAMDFWWRLGYLIAGPMLLGFARYISGIASERKLRRLFFCARDGLVLKRIFDATGLAPDGVEFSYLLASRRCFNVANITEIDDKTLEFLVGGTSRLAATEFIERVGIDVSEPEVQALSSELFPDSAHRIHSPDDYKKLHELFKRLGPRILETANRERESLLGYLRSQRVFEGPVGLIDIGWHGSLQMSLNKLGQLPDTEPNLHGIYFGLYRHAAVSSADKGSLQGYFFDYGQPAQNVELVQKSVEVIELLFSAPEQGIESVVRSGDQYLAVRQKDPRELVRIDIAAAIQRGAIEFAVDAVDSGILRDLPDIKPFVRSTLQGLLAEPEKEEAIRIGAVEHAEGFGISNYKAIIPASANAWSPLQKRRGYQATFWKTGFRVLQPSWLRWMFS